MCPKKLQTLGIHFIVCVCLWFTRYVVSGNNIVRSNVELGFSALQLLEFNRQQCDRTVGDSGIKNVKVNHFGKNNYESETHVGATPLNLRDESHFERKVGIGRFTASMNGFEFLSTLKSYHLKMPSTKSKVLNAVEDIQFPDVPEAVLKQKSVEDAISEMRQWFTAWQKKDEKIRPYKPYFKANLCYLEGAWAKAKDKELGETPNILFGKRILSNDGEINPDIGHWHYRILCYPIKEDIPTNYFHRTNELNIKFFQNSLLKSNDTPSASTRFGFNAFGSVVGGQYHVGLIDKLMSLIPGKDNGGNITGSDGAVNGKKGQKLNLAYYTRWFTLSRDALGFTSIHRGFADEFFFAARTAQDGILGRTRSTICKFPPKANRKSLLYRKWTRLISKEPCIVTKQKWTWAIPIEVIYLTPLNKWNPFNFQVKSAHNDVTDGGRRDGSCSKEKAFNGVSTQGAYYLTPSNFFSGERSKHDAIDSAKKSVCVLDRTGNMKKVTSSGIRLELPPIAGAGDSIRTRFPVFPTFGEGSGVWKELNAVKAIFQNKMYKYKYAEGKTMGVELVLEMFRSQWGSRPLHRHQIVIPAKLEAFGPKYYTVQTSFNEGHSHSVMLRKINYRGRPVFKIFVCDGMETCPDGHYKFVYQRNPYE